MSTLYERLKAYGESDHYGFHMPGHKRNVNLPGFSSVNQIDITEIDGFDDLHHAEGILKEAQIRAAELYHGDETHFLVNGSTVGILSAICGVTQKGDTILVARNCHKSVYHAIYMQELHPVYLYPGFDREVGLNTEITVQDVADALENNPKIRAVVIVSPTYDGVVSDVAAIAEAVHEKGIPLIVDEAHGAHFGYHPYFPDNSNTKGADIVIHSLHKTLPALTQTALLHMNGELVNRERVRRYLHMLQTSSPSYVLMASIDSCIDLLKNRQEELFLPYVTHLKETREKLKDLKHLEIVETEHYDPSKIVISVRHAEISSRELYRRLLEEYHLQMEMVAGTYVLAMTTVGDTEEGMRRLVDALVEIDSSVQSDAEQEALQRADGSRKSDIMWDSAEAAMRKTDILQIGELPRLEAVYTSSAMEHLAEDTVKAVPWTESVGYISTEYAYLYPPGSPLIVPGERITEEAVRLLAWYKEQEFSIEGLKTEEKIEVWLNG